MSDKKQNKDNGLNIEDFFTQAAVEEGVKIPLTLADGTETDHWLKVIGVDSELALKAQITRDRKLSIKNKGKSKSKVSKTITLQEVKETEDLIFETYASLVVDWSFDRECTKENIIELFTNARYISIQVKEAAEDQSNFMKSNLKDS